MNNWFNDMSNNFKSGSMMKLYQKGMWYMKQSFDEVSKPLRLFTEAGILLLLLSDSGLHLSLWHKVIVFVVLNVIAMIIGRILVYTGIINYCNHLHNSVNPELLEILERVKRIENKVNKK